MIIKKNYLLLKLLLFSKKVFHISSEIFKEFFPFFVEILPFVFGIPTGVPSKVCPCHIFLLAILQELLQKSLPNSFWYFTISFLKTVRWFVLGIPGIPSASPSEVLQGTIWNSFRKISMSFFKIFSGSSSWESSISYFLNCSRNSLWSSSCKFFRSSRVNPPRVYGDIPRSNFWITPQKYLPEVVPYSVPGVIYRWSFSDFQVEMLEESPKENRGRM